MNKGTIAGIALGVVAASALAGYGIFGMTVNSKEKEKLDLQKQNEVLTENNSAILGQLGRYTTLSQDYQSQLNFANTQLASVRSQLNIARQTISEYEDTIQTLVASNSEKDEEIAELQSQIQTLNSRVTYLENRVIDLENELETKDTSITSLQGQIVEKNNTISSLNSQIVTLNGELSDLNSQITNLNSDISNKQSQIASLNSELEEVSNLKYGKYVSSIADENNIYNDTYIEILSNGKFKYYIDKENYVEMDYIATGRKVDDTISINFEEDGEVIPMSFVIDSNSSFVNSQDENMRFVFVSEELADLLETRQALQSQLVNEQSDKVQIQSELDSANSSISQLEDTVSSYMNEVSDLTLQIVNLQSSLTTVTESKENLETQVSTLSSRVSELESQVTTLTQDKQVLQSQVNTLLLEKQTLETQKSTLEGEKATLETSVTEKQNTIDTLTQEKSEALSTISELQGIVEEKNAQISQMQTSINGYLTQIENINGQLAEANSQIATLNAVLASYHQYAIIVDPDYVDSIQVNDDETNDGYVITNPTSRNYLFYDNQSIQINFNITENKILLKNTEAIFTNVVNIDGDEAKGSTIEFTVVDNPFMSFVNSAYKDNLGLSHVYDIHSINPSDLSSWICDVSFNNGSYFESINITSFDIERLEMSFVGSNYSVDFNFADMAVHINGDSSAINSILKCNYQLPDGVQVTAMKKGNLFGYTNRIAYMQGSGIAYLEYNTDTRYNITIDNENYVLTSFLVNGVSYLSDIQSNGRFNLTLTSGSMNIVATTTSKWVAYTGSELNGTWSSAERGSITIDNGSILFSDDFQSYLEEDGYYFENSTNVLITNNSNKYKFQINGVDIFEMTLNSDKLVITNDYTEWHLVNEEFIKQTPENTATINGTWVKGNISFTITNSSDVSSITPSDAWSFGDHDIISSLTKVDDSHYSFTITSMEVGNVEYLITLTDSNSITISYEQSGFDIGYDGVIGDYTRA